MHHHCNFTSHNILVAYDSLFNPARQSIPDVAPDSLVADKGAI
jgi:hypothetical protein